MDSKLVKSTNHNVMMLQRVPARQTSDIKRVLHLLV